VGVPSPPAPPPSPPQNKKKTSKKENMVKGAVQPDLVTRDYTIHLSKRIHKLQFKRRAPRAVKEIKQFAQKAMATKDVRVHPELNKFIWTHGIKNVPTRVRVRLTRKRNDDEEADEKLYTIAQLVEVTSFKGLQTETIVDA
jgi:large subunit ribosomal protein L31e